MRHRSIAALFLIAALAGCSHGPDRNSPLNESAYTPPIKVACVGDSITEGRGLGDNTYPEQLQRMLGSNFEIRNFGVSGATLLEQGDKPYTQQDLYHQSLSFRPNVVVIMLGTNDSKPQNWQFKSRFEPDYKRLVHTYASLPSHPRIWLVYPTPVTGENKYSIREAPVDAETGIIDVAHSRHAGVIDIHGALHDHEDDFPDHVHPNAEGAGYMAATVYQSLMGKPYKGPIPASPAANP
jgi:lysophospholipase L1-like esterase